MTNINESKTGKSTRAENIVAGLHKRYPNGATVLPLESGIGPTSVDAAVVNLNQIVDNRAAVVAARLALANAVGNEKKTAAALLVFLRAMTAFIRFTFGADAAALGDFGMTPRKAPTPRTPAQRTVAAEKAKATREARGTKGPKAKKAIKGNVDVTVGVVVTPHAGAPTVPATAGPAPAPAAPAAPATNGTPAKA